MQTTNTSANNTTGSFPQNMNPAVNQMTGSFPEQMNAQHPTLSEKELLNDLLNQEKQIVSVYSTGVTEASCPNLRNVLTSQWNQTTQDQFRVWDQMHQRGYYQTKDAADADVQQAKQKFQSMQNQLS